MILYERTDIWFVFDVYKEHSIKNTERSRGTTAIIGTQFKNIALRHKVQQWSKFLANSANKKSLIKVLKQWVETGEVQAKGASQESIYRTRCCLHKVLTWLRRECTRVRVYTRRSMNSHSKREVSEIFNINEENLLLVFFLKPATNLSII